jgi:hypothetical protein
MAVVYRRLVHVFASYKVKAVSGRCGDNNSDIWWVNSRCSTRLDVLR